MARLIAAFLNRANGPKMNAFCGNHVRLSVHPSATKVVVEFLSNSLHELFFLKSINMQEFS
jgi:hypothetical protein